MAWKRPGLDSYVFFFRQSHSQDHGWILESAVSLYCMRQGLEKVVSLLGHKQQDLGIQEVRCSKAEDRLDSCSQSVSQSTGNHLIKQIEKQSVILHPCAVPRIKVLMGND